MSEFGKQSGYAELIQRNLPVPRQIESAQDELDALVTQYQHHQRTLAEEESRSAGDRIQQLREDMVCRYIPVFVQLTEKYARSGMQLEMDASSLLQGGRELRFLFRLGGYRSEMNGVVTSDAIAFHETTFTPQVGGEIASGPMLRLRRLNEESFRDFICQRLAVLLRTAMGRR